MSRTYRTHEDHKLLVHGQLKTWKDEHAAAKAVGAWTLGWHHTWYINRKARDRKPWNKPPKSFKQPRRRLERAKANQALRMHKDLPVVKHNDQWDWT
jgi:hypothetical protein